MNTDIRVLDIAQRSYETFSQQAGPMMFTPWESLPPIVTGAWVAVVLQITAEASR